MRRHQVLIGLDPPPARRLLSSGVSSQRSGSSGPSWSGTPPFSFMQPLLSPIDATVATSSGLSRMSRGTAASSARFCLDRLGGLARLLDQGRDDALDRLVREVPLARELERRQAVRAAYVAHPLELLAPLLDPARRA